MRLTLPGLPAPRKLERKHAPISRAGARPAPPSPCADTEPAISKTYLEEGGTGCETAARNAPTDVSGHANLTNGEACEPDVLNGIPPHASPPRSGRGGLLAQTERSAQ